MDFKKYIKILFIILLLGFIFSGCSDSTKSDDLVDNIPDNTQTDDISSQNGNEVDQILNDDSQDEEVEIGSLI